MLQLEAVIKWPKPTINWRAHRLCFIAHSLHQAITSMLWFSSTLTDHICSYLYHYIFFHLTWMFVFPITSYFPLITVHFTSSPLFLLWPATAFFILILSLTPYFFYLCSCSTLSDQYVRIGHSISRSSFSTSTTYLTGDLLIGPLIIFIIGILSIVILNVSFLFRSVN